MHMAAEWIVATGLATGSAGLFLAQTMPTPADGGKLAQLGVAGVSCFVMLVSMSAAAYMYCDMRKASREHHEARDKMSEDTRKTLEAVNVSLVEVRDTMREVRSEGKTNTEVMERCMGFSKDAMVNLSGALQGLKQHCEDTIKSRRHS